MSNVITSENLQHILEVLPAGIIVLDSDGIICHCNPAALELLGAPLLSEPWINIIERAFAPRMDDGHEISLKNGKRISLATRARVDEPGQILVLTDMTETRDLLKTVSRYRRLSEMGRVAASLAHQIRTPLSAALLYAGHLKNPDLSPEKHDKFVHKLNDRLSNIESQINEMLIFVQGGEQQKHSFTLSEWLEAIDRNASASLSRHNVDWHIRQAEGTDQISLFGNIDALTGIVGNLINNAIEAGGEGIMITLSIEPISNDNTLKLCIADNGPGIPASQLESVQEAFITTKTHGTGLGLAVVKTVIEAHKGTFYLQSEPESGTQAILTIPIELG